MDVQSVYADLKSKARKAIDYVSQELRQIRTGQASPSLVEDMPVTTYEGTATLTLKELATIATEGPTMLIIEPFDPQVIRDIEKAIASSPLGLSTSVDGKIIRITTPPLTEEQREKFVKLANQKIEEGKVQLRRLRDDARKDIKALIDEKLITEDDKFRAEKEIDSISKELSDELDDLKQRKQDDIMSV